MATVIPILKWQASLADGQVAASKGTLYTSSGKSVITFFSCHNTGVVTETVVVYLERSGTSRVFWQGDLGVGETAWILAEGDPPITLSSTDLIEGKTTNATKVDYFISGEAE